MELVRGSDKLRPRQLNRVVAFGGFDGLHLGHRAIIERALGCAKENASRPSVVLFEPLPHEFLQPSEEVPRLYTLRERLEIIASLGVDQVVCLRFNERLAAMRAEEFIKRVLVDEIKVHTLLVGDGFRFGRGREGDVALLLECAKQYGFALECVDTVLADDGERISSTWVRELLAQGDFVSAARLLGRDYSVSGRVGYGEQRGRRLGFSTANLFVGRHFPPVRGVFAVAVERAASQTLRGVANVGYRPTFGENKLQFEVHLPGFSGNLYGRRLRVRFLAKIRDEQRFDSVEALREHIRKDVEKAMEIPLCPLATSVSQ